MKILQTKTGIIFLLMFILSIGCKEEQTKSLGEIVVYTNAQSMLNCGPFEVKIYVDEEYIGSLFRPYTDLNQPDCISTDETLVYELPQGSYLLKAIFDCGRIGYLEKNIEVFSDTCTPIFIDIRDKEK